MTSCSIGAVDCLLVCTVAYLPSLPQQGERWQAQHL